MRKLNFVSWAMTMLGAALLVVALLLDLGAMAQLTGILLLWAGIIKICVVLLWTHVAHLGTDQHDPINQN